MRTRAESILLLVLALYSISILISQATMSVGIAVLIIPAVVAFGGIPAFFRRIRASLGDPTLRGYLRYTNFVAFACILSLVGARFFPVDIGGVSPEVRWVKDLWKLWYPYWPIILVPCLRELSTASRRTLWRVFFWTFGIVATIGCVQVFTGWPRPTLLPGQTRFYHANGFFGHHLSFASIMIFPLFLVLEEAVERKVLGRSISIPIALVGLAAIVATHSRQAWISVALGLLVFAGLRLPRRTWWAAGVVAVLAVVSVVQIPTIRSRAINLGELRDRIELWKVNIAFFEMRPITGVGWHHNLDLAGAYMRTNRPEVEHPFVGHAHSNFFEFLGAMGIVGALAYLAWAFMTLRMAFRASAGFFAAWLVFHMNGLTQVNFWESKVLHSSMWSIALMVGFQVSRDSRRERSDVTPNASIK